MLRLLLTANLLLHICTASPFFRHSSSGPKMPDKRAPDPKYRLESQNITIDKYEITMTPHLSGENAFTFDGEAKLTAKASGAGVDKITVHAKMLKNIKVHVVYPNGDGEDLLPERVSDIDPIYDFLTVTFRELIDADQIVTITFAYNGILGDEMIGFYRSSYEENGVTKWLATTQFQPGHARRAFPCFDEPKYKAKFVVTTKRPKHFKPSLSNTKMNTALTKEEGDYVVETFHETPYMSTYLVAFIVSEYEAASSTSADEEPFAIWGRPEAKAQGGYALNISINSVNALGEYLNFPFKDMDPNLKNDHVSIPDILPSGMENWGLVTYREAYLMYHPTETSVRYKQQIATVLAHEIAHFWFGDLVTCHWWSETWLHEGFARYFQYYLTDMIESMEMDAQFNVVQIQPVFLDDTEIDSAPMTNPNTYSPDEVQAQLGSITYSKGATVVRMMRNWLGSSVFRNTLIAYVEANKYKNVEKNVLFEHLQMEAEKQGALTDYDGATVAEVMGSWTEQSGFPVLRVDYKNDTKMILITQERFTKKDIPTTNALWKIPVTYTKGSDKAHDDVKPKFIMNGKYQELAGVTLENDEWIIFNVLQSGYYRVEYDDHLLDLISKTLSGTDRETIHKHNRAQIVDDLFNFARENRLYYPSLFDYIQFLESEVDYAPWSAAIAGFSFLRLRFISFKDTAGLIDHHILKLMEKSLLPKLGIAEQDDDDTHLIKLFRMNTFNLACQIGHEECQGESTKLFQKLKNGTGVISANVREYVYCTALRYGDSSDFEFLWNKYVTENVISEKVVILNALGCSLVEDRLVKLLYKTISESSPIRVQDKMAAFNSVLNGNPSNIEEVFNFVQDNIPAIRNVYSSGSLETMFGSMSARMNKDQLSMLENALTTNIYLSSEEKASGLASIKSAEKNIKWAEDLKADIDIWITDKYN